jgi:hypothetical protein
MESELLLAKDEGGEVVDRVKDTACCGPVTIAVFNATWVGICFLGLFSSFNPIQSLQSGTAKHNLGFYGIAVLYGVFSVSTLVSSQVVRILGQKLGLFLGALCYLIYIATLLILALIPDMSETGYAVSEVRRVILVSRFLRRCTFWLRASSAWGRRCCGPRRARC